MLHTNRIRLLLPLIAVFAVVACKPQSTPDASADKAALQTAAERWEPAYDNKDSAAVAALYADDAELLPPGMAAVKGLTAINEFWANDVATNWSKLTLKVESSDLAGDWAWRSGTWMTAETTPALTGKWVEVWHRTAGGWKIHRDIWNMDAAPAAAPAATPAAPAQ